MLKSARSLHIAMFSIHTSPIGPLGADDTGGMSVYLRELSQALAQRGHRVDIYTQPLQQASAGDQDLGAGVRLRQLRLDPKSMVSKEKLIDHLPLYAQKVLQKTRQEKCRYDVIHSHYWLSAIAGRSLAEVWRCPHVVSFHTLGYAKKRVGDVVRERIEQRIQAETDLARGCERVIVSVLAEKEDLRRAQIDPAKIAVIPCGVNLKHFRPMPGDGIRQKYQIRGRCPLVLFVGRLVYLKGVDRLLEVFQQLLIKTDARLLVMGGNDGDCPATEALRQRSRQLGIAAKVIFAGRVPHARLPAYYNAADCMVIPSRYESFGMVALEALACGTPVVTARVGAMRTLIEDGVNGFVVDMDDRPATVQAICKIMDARVQIRLRAKAIREKCQRFDWSHIAAQVEAVYTQTTDSNHAKMALDDPLKESS